MARRQNPGTRDVNVSARIHARGRSVDRVARGTRARLRTPGGRRQRPAEIDVDSFIVSYAAS
jgi:hypothetical protein